MGAQKKFTIKRLQTIVRFEAKLDFAIAKSILIKNL
jgi:hypothetical protein